MNLDFWKWERLDFWIFYAAMWSHEKMYVLNWKTFSLNNDVTNAKNRLKIIAKVNWKAFSLNGDVTNAKIEAESLPDQTTTIDLVYFETKHMPGFLDF